nr:hypothetical protein [Rubripirellula obstinata]
MSEIGETVDGVDVVRFRGFNRDTTSALTTAMAVAKEHPRLEVHATGTLPIFVMANFGFPVDVIQVAARSRVVGLRRFLFPRHLDVLSTFQRVASANVEIVALSVLSNALSGRHIVSTTQRFDADPVSMEVQRIGGTFKAVRDPIVVGPSSDDS